ncbi:MAG: hypothetical protein AUH39_00425 [Chloroflexi bacterium 13_1_40CM_67_9]|nr:MAG: hypothetical protein AUH39_00425 [Chloroflexi bacterium 13_1_40CM_67_9]
MDAARLRRDADIAAVWSEGIAPRSLGRAVARNRSRRRLREAFRGAIRDLARGPGCDLVIVARPQIASAAFGEIREAASGALASLTLRVSVT